MSMKICCVPTSFTNNREYRHSLTFDWLILTGSHVTVRAAAQHSDLWQLKSGAQDESNVQLSDKKYKYLCRVSVSQDHWFWWLVVNTMELWYQLRDIITNKPLNNDDDVNDNDDDDNDTVAAMNDITVVQGSDCNVGAELTIFQFLVLSE